MAVSNSECLIEGIHHLGLTVVDLPKAVSFFTDLLGYQKLGERPEYPAAFVSDGHNMLTLWQAKDPENCQPFNRHNNIGMHHFALKVADISTLNAVYEKLKNAGVEIEFAPEIMQSSGATHMMCAIPGGARIEFVAPKQ